MAKYLSQVIGICDDVAKDSQRRITEAHHALQHPAMLEGIERKYSPLQENGQQLPDEGTLVQITAAEMIAETRAALARVFDATAARDFTNAGDTGAVADVKTGDQVLVEKAPVPYLLWMINQLNDITTFVKKLPVQDAGTEWTLHDERGVYQSPPSQSFRTEKKPQRLILFEPTKEHEGKAEVYSETFNVGVWTQVKFTGALPAHQRAAMLRRVEQLREAVTEAKNEANRVEAKDPRPGAAVMSFIFD